MALRTIGRRAVLSSSSSYGDDAGLEFIGSLFEQWRDKVDHGLTPSPHEIKAAAKEVLTRWELEEDRQIPLDPKDLADAVQILERQRAVEQADAMVEGLGPAAAAIHACLSTAMSEHVAKVEARLGSPKPHLFIIVRAPGHKWHAAVHRAFYAWIMALEAVLRQQTTDVSHVHPETCFSSGNKRERKIDVGRILKSLADCHVVATVHDEEVQPLLLSIADVVVDLSSQVGPAEFAGVVAARFDGRRPDWPEDLYVFRFRPEVLEAALLRAVEPDDVHGLVMSVGLAEGVEAACKSADAADEAARRVKKVAGPVTRPIGPKLADLAGYGAARTWGESLAADLADYRSGAIGWEDVDAGCLLHGPPGTGKTLFASALAATCDVPFIATSYADWQAKDGGHAGDVLKAIKTVFETANKNAPCIVFIDEIDAVGSRAVSSRYDDWFTMVITCLLECLDGTSRREGVVVVAAWNHPQRLDPALVRSGRLDRRFAIELPDEAALIGILAHHLPGIEFEVLGAVATTLGGSTSGADAARIAREARRIARRAGRDLAVEDLLAVAMPADDLGPAARRLVAVHEAGHAIAFMAHGSVPESMSLVPIGDSHGRVLCSVDLGMGHLADIEREVVCRLAGRAAEEVLLEEPSAGAEGDLSAATKLLGHTMGACGLGGRLLHDGQVPGHEIEARLRDLYGRALRLIGQHRHAVEALADLALEKRVLGRKALEAFAADHLPDAECRR